MTKFEWQKHWQEEGPHDSGSCDKCKARSRTKRANLRAKINRQVYSDLGMHRVKCALGGIYYE